MNTIRLPRSLRVFSIALMVAILFLFPLPTRRVYAAGVVGTGTPGSCTEAALNAALSGGGLVTFNCGGAKTITLTSTKTISKNTTIQGGNQITLSGGNSVRLFLVNSGITLTLQDISIINGKSYDGAGLFNNGGTVNVIHSTFSGNHADCTGAGTCYAYGGAIRNQNHGVMNITESTFTNNYGGPEPYVAKGGAIYNSDGTVIIAHSSFTNNASQEGGAIENYQGTLQVTGVSTFTLNIATCAGSPKGGAIFNDDTLIVEDATFDHNHATSTGGSNAYGGAIYSSDSMAVKDSSFTTNYAASMGGLGGAIWAESESTITGSDFSENYTGNNSYGGSIYYNVGSHIIEDSTFNGRTGGFMSSMRGGAIYNQNATLSMDNTTFSGNFATDGGGIFNNSPSTLTITGSRFIHNNAYIGGGINNSGTVEITDSTFENNSATTSATPTGGGIFSTGTLTLIRTHFDRNSATSSGSWGAQGGGIYSSNILDVTDSTFSQNTISASDGARDGSAIYAISAMTITGSTFFDNHAIQGNGTIYLTDGAFVVINTTIYSNSVATAGSAFLNYHLAKLSMYNSTISNNVGQAISFGPVNPGVITMTNSIIANNASNCLAPPVDNGGNLQFGGLIANSCGLTIPVLNPLLDPFADYGGPTHTMRLRSTSPARNLANANCPPIDQRGFTRSDHPCDSGAYEIGGTGVALSSSANPSLPWKQVIFTATVEESDAHIPTGTITFKDNGIVLDTVSVDATGKATFSTLYKKTGDHPITAEYSGDLNFNPSQSPVMIQMVSSINNFLPLITKQ